MRSDPSALDLSPGQLVTLHIMLENASDVYGIDLRASFDPALVEIMDADPAQDGIQMIPGTFVKPDFVVRNAVENGTGSLRYVVTQVNPTPPATGSGILVSLQARGKAAGKSELKIESVQMADRRGQALAVQHENSVNRVAPPQVAPTSAAAISATADATRQVVSTQAAQTSPVPERAPRWEVVARPCRVAPARPAPPS